MTYLDYKKYYFREFNTATGVNRLAKQQLCKPQRGVCKIRNNKQETERNTLEHTQNTPEARILQKHSVTP